MNRIVIRAPKFARKVATDISWIMLIISHWLLVSYPTRSGCWEKNVHLRPTYNSDVWIVGERRTSKWTLNHTNNITKITQPIAHPSGGYFFHNLYSLCFKIKVTFGEISLKLRQINWNVAKINVNVVCWWTTKSNNNPHLFNNWYLDSTAPTHINAVFCASVPPAQNGGLPDKLTPKVVNFTMDTPSLPQNALSKNYAMHIVQR